MKRDRILILLIIVIVAVALTVFMSKRDAGTTQDAVAPGEGSISLVVIGIEGLEPELIERFAATGELRRYHMQGKEVHRALKQAVAAAAITKRVTPHTFRHSFASHLLQANYDIRTIQELLGHSDVKTTMIYAHTVPSRTLKERRSPLDL